MKRKILALVLAVMFLVGATSIPASAVNNGDTNFEIHMSSPGVVASQTYAARMKEDSSSTYINYYTRASGSAASGPYQFEAQIWGYYSDSPYYFTYCFSSLYGTKFRRSKSIITRGTYGLMRQDVFERYPDKPYAQVYGAMISESGIAKGCWSPDSIDYGYSYYNYVIG